MSARLRQHPLHLAVIAVGMVGTAVLYWIGQPDQLVVGALVIAFVTAIDLARRLGLEPPNDPAAPQNRGKA